MRPIEKERRNYCCVCSLLKETRAHKKAEKSEENSNDSTITSYTQIDTQNILIQNRIEISSNP